MLPDPDFAKPSPAASALADLDAAAAQGETRDARWANLLFLRRLAVYLKPYKARFIVGEIAGIGFAFFNGIIPLLLKAVFDHTPDALGHSAKAPEKANLIGGGLGHFFNVLAEGKHGVIIVCATIPAVMIIRCLFDYINNYCVAWVSLRVLSDIRKQVFEHINRQSLQFFLQNRSGNLISRVSNETRIIQAALGFLGTDLVEQPITAIIVICVLFKLDARFTFIALVLFPLCMVPVIVYGKRIRKNGRKEEEQGGAMIAILQETFAGIRVIKSFAREDYQVEQFDAANVAQFHTAIRVRKYTEIVGPMVEIVAAVGVGLALVYVQYAGMKTSTFLGLTGGLFLLYQPIKQISRMHVQIQKCRAASEHIFKLLELQPTVRDAPDAAELTRPRGEVEFRHLSFQYETAVAPALDDFHLHIRPGQTVALVGVSGAGKSTVLSLLQRFYEPAAGQVCIDGQDISQVTQRSLRENIGVVTQDTFLFHDTIYENIRYGRLDATLAEIEAAAKQAYIHDFIHDAARRLPDAHRRQGLPPERRAAAARGDCAGAAQERADPAARRGDQRARQRERTHDPERAGNAFPGQDGHRHRAPAFDDPESGHDHRDGCGADRRAGTARGAIQSGRTLPAFVRFAVRAPARHGRGRAGSRGDDPADGDAGMKEQAAQAAGRDKVGMPLRGTPYFGWEATIVDPGVGLRQSPPFRVRECLGEASLPYHDRRFQRLSGCPGYLLSWMREKTMPPQKWVNSASLENLTHAAFPAGGPPPRKFRRDAGCARSWPCRREGS